MYNAEIFLNILLSSLLFTPGIFSLPKTLLLKNSSIRKENYHKSKCTTLENNVLLLKKLKRDVANDNYKQSREAYEREVNDNITNYYAQRKAVMDRYHARQEEITEKFRAKTGTPSTYAVATTDKTAYVYESSPGSQDDIPYNEVASCQVGFHLNASEESLVYQHNIHVGLKGQSELNAAIEVLLDRPIKITCVEMTPLENSNARIQHLAGGRGYNYVKLKLIPNANEGLSYIIKIWGETKI